MSFATLIRHSLWLVLALGACDGAPEPPKITSVVIWGHGYSLFVEPPHLSKFVTDDLWPTFVDEVNRIAPDAAFGLGDHTFHSTPAEWAWLLPELQRIEADVHLLRGNHDTGEIPFHPDLALERRNKTVDIGQQRFILLDARQEYTEEDLAFLTEAVAGSDTRANTFVLMHFASFLDAPLADAPADADTGKPYSGYGNWNSDVAPLLRGTVRYVFCGDTYDRLAGHYDQQADGLCYIRAGFPFQGAGPLVFLELRFAGDELQSIIPRAVPVDLRHSWYDGR